MLAAIEEEMFEEEALQCPRAVEDKSRPVTFRVSPW